MNTSCIYTEAFHVLDESRNWPLCGGNKIRKLAALLEGTRPNGLLTHGSVYSSHCLAAACWGARHRIPVRLLILSEQPELAFDFPHVRLSQNLGADVVVVGGVAARERIDAERKKYADYAWVPGGGHGPAAMEAYRAWFGRQLDEEPSLRARKWVILPYGTGTTALGIWSAVRERALSMRVIGVSVSRTRDRSLKAAAELVPDDALEGMVIDDRFAGQYGHHEAHHGALRRSFLERTGIWADPIYNVRVVEVLESDRMDNGIVIHTGGQWNNLIR